MSKPSLIILGAGPAGLGAAFKLSQRQLAHVLVLEREPWVGGNAASFEFSGIHLDYGSHRLHHACDPKVLHDISSMLGGDLLDRPRHGRIRLRGRWIHFPLRPLGLAFQLPLSFTMGVATDLARKVLGRKSARLEEETFASVLEAGLGRTICRDFYFPYARKLWGLEAEELSEAQAHRRVSANSLTKMFRKVFSSAPGFKHMGSGRFFYPRLGFGQISESYCRAAEEAGAEIHLNTQVLSVEIEEASPKRVLYIVNGEKRSIDADYVWSTIPITDLLHCLKPRPSQEYLDMASHIGYRAMILIYLILEQERFSEYDAHYFPDPGIRISRLSEPKNYSDGHGLPGITALCAELPCSKEDREWRMSDEELGLLVCDALSRAEIPIRVPLREVFTRRLKYAYPIYQKGYEIYFDQLDQMVNQVDGMLSFGRQGLFAHDNTHHALYMAYAAVECLDTNGQFDRNRWGSFREIFKNHVVED